MIRLFNVIAFISVALSVIFAYSVKYETQKQHEEMRNLQVEISREREEIGILQAEWALLNRPERLQKLSEKHLSLQQLDVRQLARISELKERPKNRNSLSDQLSRLGLGGALTTPSTLSDLSEGTTPLQLH